MIKFIDISLIKKKTKETGVLHFLVRTNKRRAIIIKYDTTTTQYLIDNCDVLDNKIIQDILLLIYYRICYIVINNDITNKRKKKLSSNKDYGHLLTAYDVMFYFPHNCLLYNYLALYHIESSFEPLFDDFQSIDFKRNSFEEMIPSEDLEIDKPKPKTKVFDKSLGQWIEH